MQRLSAQWHGDSSGLPRGGACQCEQEHVRRQRGSDGGFGRRPVDRGAWRDRGPRVPVQELWLGQCRVGRLVPAGDRTRQELDREPAARAAHPGEQAVHSAVPGPRVGLCARRHAAARGRHAAAAGARQHARHHRRQGRRRVLHGLDRRQHHQRRGGRRRHRDHGRHGVVLGERRARLRAAVDLLSGLRDHRRRPAVRRRVQRAGAQSARGLQPAAHGRDLGPRAALDRRGLQVRLLGPHGRGRPAVQRHGRGGGRHDLQEARLVPAPALQRLDHLPVRELPRSRRRSAGRRQGHLALLGHRPERHGDRAHHHGQHRLRLQDPLALDWHRAERRDGRLLVAQRHQRLWPATN